MADLEKFDPSTLADKVRERIRNSIADLIPDDAWATLIKKEVDVFFAPQQETSHQRYQPSTISEMVRLELQGEVKKRLQTFFQSPDWAGRWEYRNGINHYAASEELRKLILENANTIVTSMLGQAFQSFIASLPAHLR